MKTYDRLASLLQDHGVEVVFGLMGDANMYWLTAFQEAGGRFVPVVHEASSVTMADTYSRMSSSIGVATVTHGPGFTNALTALVDATRSRSSVLFITGDPPSEPTHPQRVGFESVCAAAGVGYERACQAESLSGDLNRALRRIVAERRPIVLNVPRPLQLGEAVDQAEAVTPPSRLAAVAPAPSETDDALGLIASSRKPLIVAGRGAVQSQAGKDLVRLGELLGAPLATTALATGLFRGHPSNISIFGSMSHDIASQAISESDCIVAFGASLNAHTTMSGELVHGKRVVHIDQDSAAIGFYVPADEQVIADARLSALAMSNALTDAGHDGSRGWLRGIQAQLVENTAQNYRDESTAETVDIRTAVIELDRQLPDSRVIASDVGRFVTGTWPHMNVLDACDFTATSGFACIGHGLASGVGAAVARPDQLTVALLGDGGFMMYASEFVTAVREDLRLLVVVLNDGAYGAEHQKLKAHGINPDYALNRWPDLAPLAKAMGGTGETITSIEQVRNLGPRLSTLTNPHFLDIRISPNQHFAY